MPLLVQALPKECAKAAKIFQSFVDSGNNGLDGVVPRSILERAKGFAIFTVVKAGFIVSARAGSGVVIARLDDGSWSAPSAIGTAGMGLGTQAGAEVTDFLIVLNTRAALKTFMSTGSFTLGGNLSIAVGPLGRNGEAIGSLSSGGTLAAMYSYSKTRGLFGGVSLEGSVVVERQDANALAYGKESISVKALLSGAVPPPQWAQPLVATLQSCTGMPGGREWVHDSPATLSPAAERGDPFAAAASNSREYAFGGVASPGSVTPGMLKKKKPTFPPMAWGRTKSTGSYFDDYAPNTDSVTGGGSVDPFKLSNQGYQPAGANHRRPSKSDDLSKSMQKLALGNSASAKGSPGASMPASTSTPAPTSFTTHFDSDFVPESTPAPPKKDMNVDGTFAGLSPGLVSALPQNGNGRKDSEVDLLDFGPNPDPSPLDFDPLGPSARMQPGARVPSNPAPTSTSIGRPSAARASSNPFFDLDTYRPPPPPASGSYTGHSQSFSPAPASPPIRYGGTSSPSGSRTFSPASSPFGVAETAARQSPLAGVRQNQQSMFGEPDSDDDLYTPKIPRPSSSAQGPSGRRKSTTSPAPNLSLRPELATPLPSWAKGRAIALFDFDAVQAGDLSFKTGQVITIMEMSGNTDTWWKGTLDGRTGIFPANFVELA